MKKRIIILVVALCFLLSNPVCAAMKKTYVPSLTFNGTTANCYISVTEIGKSINITLELWHGNTLVDSWSKSGTTYVRIDEYCTVTSGYTYTLIVTGTIGGTTISCTPVTNTCP